MAGLGGGGGGGGGEVHVTPASFIAARDGALCVLTGGAVLYTLLLPVLVVRFRQLVPKGVTRSDRPRRMVFWIIVNVAVNLGNVVQTALVQLEYADDRGDGRNLVRCSLLQKLSVVLYGLSTYAVYWFLVVRSEAMLDKSNYWQVLVYRLCKLSLCTTAPGLIVLGAIYLEGEVIFGWACTLEISVVPVALFAILDLGMTLLLLLLFYLPVRKHLADLDRYAMPRQIRSETGRMKHMAVRVWRLSLMQAGSTLAVQIVGLASQLALDDAAAPNLAYWRLVRYMLYAMDLWANTVCMLAMSDAWVPTGWTRLETILTATHIRRSAHHRSAVAPSALTTASTRHLVAGQAH